MKLSDQTCWKPIPESSEFGHDENHHTSWTKRTDRYLKALACVTEAGLKEPQFLRERIGSELPGNWAIFLWAFSQLSSNR